MDEIKEIEHFPEKHVIHHFGDGGKATIIHATPCDFCKTIQYSENRQKRGKALYIVCQRCCTFSVPRKMYSQGFLIKMMERSIERPKSSGKQFSKAWTSRYASAKKKAVESSIKGEENEPEMPEEHVEKPDEKDNDEQTPKEEKNESVVMAAVETVKAIAQSGVSGLVQGASEAISSLTHST
jgi:hypothetical protein